MNAGPLIFAPGGSYDYQTASQVADSIAASQAAQTTALDAAGRLMVSVKTYGAAGDGVTNDTAAFQAAIDAVVAVGGELHIPHGAYLITGSGLTINESGAPGQSFTDRTRISLRGDGPGNTWLTYTGTGSCLTYTGSGVSAGIDALLSLSDFTIAGPGRDPPYHATVGLRVELAAYFEVRNLLVYSFGIGIYFTDALSFLAERISVFSCRGGIKADMDTYSSPNAVTLNACTLSFNSFYGALIDQCDCLTMVGGSVEVNGSAAAPGDGYGINLTNPGTFGASAATFLGVHFEGQQHLADILVQASADAARVCAVNAIGCAFVRNSATVYTTNCIAVSGAAAPVKLNVIGCGFRGFNDYVADAGRPYIGITPGAGAVGLTDLGNVYGSALEAPISRSFAGSVVSPKSNATAWANFSWSGSAIVISDGHNIGSITRSSTGVYVVNFAVAMGNANYAAFVTSTSGALGWADTIGTAHLTAHTTDVATAPVDPGNVFVAVYGGGAF